jgi:hypothetical protein
MARNPAQGHFSDRGHPYSLVRLRVRLEHLSDRALVARIFIVSLGWILNNPKPAGGVLNRVVLNFDARKVGNCPRE